MEIWLIKKSGLGPASVEAKSISNGYYHLTACAFAVDVLYRFGNLFKTKSAIDDGFYFPAFEQLGQFGQIATIGFGYERDERLLGKKRQQGSAEQPRQHADYRCLASEHPSPDVYSLRCEDSPQRDERFISNEIKDHVVLDRMFCEICTRVIDDRVCAETSHQVDISRAAYAGHLRTQPF